MGPPFWMPTRSRVAFRLSAPVLLAFMIASGQAMACSCQRDPTAEGILGSASTVLTGVVEDDKAVAPGQSLTTFRVTESFKGTTRGATVRIKHPSGPSPSCGVTFSPGKVYTLAASQTDAVGELSTSLCLTWMFLPHVGLSKGLIERMREMRERP